MAAGRRTGGADDALSPREIEALAGRRELNSVRKENFVRAGFGPVCGPEEMVIRFSGVFGGRVGYELSSWSDSPHI